MSKKEALKLDKHINTFKQAYENLNTNQKRAVDTIEGPVMVVAGPGTGKTQILALRVANILIQTDTKPEDILTLTFTDSGTKAMRERLRQFIGSAAYRVHIHTFHGFSQLLINEYPEAFPDIIGGSPASDLERVEAIEDALSHTDIRLLRPVGNPSYYVKPILGEIQTLKQENISPTELSGIISKQEENLKSIEQFHTKGAHKGKERGEYAKLKKEIDKNNELHLVYTLYQATLKDKKRYDFADMITSAVSALRNEKDLLRDIQERFLYVLADEHQDVNGAQNEILERIVSYHDQPNIFVVGDEKQAIYRFQGASLENFLYFQDRFKGTEVISLSNNYRSTQKILNAAHELIKVDEGPLKDLRLPLTGNQIGAEPTHYTFEHEGVEEAWLAQTIFEKIKSGISPQDIAVIVRTNREVESLTNFLRKHNINIHPSADSDILFHPVTRTVKQLITCILEPHNEVALANALILLPLNTSLDDLAKIFSARKSSIKLVSLLSSKESLESVGITNTEPYLHLVNTLEQARKQSTHKLPHDIIAFVLNETGFLTYLEIEQPIEGTRVMRRIYDEIEELERKKEATDLYSLQKAFAIREEYNLPLNAPFLDTNHEAVSVMTAHKSKGLEFEIVFIPHANDSVWGKGRKRNNFSIPFVTLIDESTLDPDDDEKRLFYVAMTRAKTGLYFSSSENSSDGKAYIPTRFLSELVTEFVKEKTDNTIENFNVLEAVYPNKKELVSAEFVTNLFKARGFSATSINNYLENPWHYLARNLLRLPEIQSLPLRYGTVMHGILEQMTSEFKEGKLADMSEVLQMITVELNKLPLSVKEYTSLHEKAVNSISAYRQHLLETLSFSAKEEFKISVQLETGNPLIPSIPLTGTLDRLDFDEGGTLLRVVDYKTGKPRSRNQIEGNTKDGNRGYKRQLEFYALLLSLYDDERYKCKEFTLSFVEPTSAGKIKEETFTITDSDVDALKTEIIQAVQDIQSGEFLYDAELARSSDYWDVVQHFVLTKKTS